MKTETWKVDHTLKNFLEGTRGVVEATNSEYHWIWREHVHDAPQNGFTKFSWDERSSGMWFNIGSVDNRPICISLRTSTVEGAKILFYEGTSELVDYRMLRDFIEHIVPDTARESDGHLNHSDAGNFVNVIFEIKNQDNKRV